MSDLMGFARKLGDLWTVELVKELSKYVERYRALFEAHNDWGKAGDDIVVIIRHHHPELFSDRTIGALKQRIDQLEKVTAGDLSELKNINSYDKPFFNTIHRKRKLGDREKTKKNIG